MPITDLNDLFGRFWVSDLASLSKLDHVANKTDYTFSGKWQTFVSPRRQLQSVVGDNVLAGQQLARAKLFAQTHPVALENERSARKEYYEANVLNTGVNMDGLKREIVQLATVMNAKRPPNEQFDMAKLLDHADLALKELFSSRQMTEFARRIQPREELTVYETLAVKNAALGLVKLLEKGRIDENSVIFALDNEIYDIRHNADLVQLAKRTRETLARTFVDKKGVDDLIETARTRVGGLIAAGKLDPKTAKALVAKLNDVRTAGNAVIEARTCATKILETDVAGVRPQKQLKMLRESMRAFRYDLDRGRGRTMGGSESIRRFWDNVGSTFRNRVSKTDYLRLRELDQDFQSSILELNRGISEGLFARGTWGGDADLELERKLGAGLVSVDDRAEEVTTLSHETNDIIRAHFVEKADFAHEMHSIFDGIVRNGGTKRATVTVGADYQVGTQDQGFRVGGAVDTTVEITVPKGGGRVLVTRSRQGGLEGGGDLKLGPAQTDISGEIKGGRSETAIYENLDDAIAALGNHSTLTSAMAGTLLLRQLTRPLRMLGSKLAMLLRYSGVLPQKTKVDNIAFRNRLVQKGVLKGVDNLLLAGKNAVALEKRATKFALVDAKGEGEFKDIATVEAGFSVRQEHGVKRTVYTTYLRGILDGNQEAREKELAKNLGLQNGRGDVDGALEDLATKLLSGVKAPEDVRAAYGELEKCLDLVEGGHAGRVTLPEAESQIVARRIKFCAAMFAVLDGRIPDKERASWRALLKGRLENPSVALDEGIFTKELMIGRKGHENAHRVTSFEIGGDLDGTYGVDGMLGTMLDKTTLPKMGVKASVKVDKPLTTDDPRPWKNKTTVSIDVDVNWSTPLQTIINVVADAIAADATGTKIPKEKAKADVIGFLAGCGLPIAAGELADLAKKGIGELLDLVPGFEKFLSNIGVKVANLAGKVVPFLEGKMETKRGFTLSFDWKDGFQSLAIGASMDTSGKVGVRVLGAGMHLGATVENTTYRMAVYPSINLETAMERFEACASMNRFVAFCKANKVAVLQLAESLHISFSPNANDLEKIRTFAEFVEKKAMEYIAKA